MKKKLVICASASFENEILAWKDQLREKFDIIRYPTKIKGELSAGYKKEFSEHYESISKTDALLALNLEKIGIPGYIGPGVFAEMAFALGLNCAFNKHIEIYYLNSISKLTMPYSDELQLWESLGWIKRFDDRK
jgi:hypothetical protein